METVTPFAPVQMTCAFLLSVSVGLQRLTVIEMQSSLIHVQLPTCSSQILLLSVRLAFPPGAV